MTAGGLFDGDQCHRTSQIAAGSYHRPKLTLSSDFRLNNCSLDFKETQGGSKRVVRTLEKGKMLWNFMIQLSEITSLLNYVSQQCYAKRGPNKCLNGCAWV